MTLLLVVIANAILTADILPVCQERIWIITLTTGSMYWALLALCESILVAYLFFRDRSDSSEETRNDDKNDGNISSDSEGPKSRDQDDAEIQIHCEHGNIDDERKQSNGDGRATGEPAERKPRPFYRLKAAGRNVLGFPFVNPTVHESSRMKTIRRLDRVSLILFPVSYIIFFSVMLARNKYW